MPLLILIVIIIFLIVLPTKNKKKKRTKQNSNSKPEVTVSFGTPKSTHNYNYPFDETRPSSNSVYSNVNFLSIFEKPHTLTDDPDEFPRFVSYNLHIYDPIKRRGELIERGLLRLATPAEILNTYKVVELKEILKANALQTTGKKSDLITRVVSSVDIDGLDLPSMCCTTEKGQNFINKNQDLIKLRSNTYGITYEEYLAAKKESPSHCSYNDIIWSVFNHRELKSKGNYNTRSLNAYHRANFLMRENKYSDALEQYIYYLYFEMNDPTRVITDSMKQYYTENELTPMQLSSDLIESIYGLKEHFSKEMVSRCYIRVDVPQVLIKQKDFEKLLKDIFAGKKIDVKNYLPKGVL